MPSSVVAVLRVEFESELQQRSCHRCQWDTRGMSLEGNTCVDARHPVAWIGLSELSAIADRKYWLKHMAINF
jgi:hypothetical protein